MERETEGAGAGASRLRRQKRLEPTGTANEGAASRTDVSRGIEWSKRDEEWRAELTPEQYQVLRQAATEAPWAGRYVDNHEDGTYRCAGCGAVLFDAAAKFTSGSGWPSFYEPATPEAVELVADRSNDRARTEVRCRGCSGHLGHVFDDGPEPTGKRYCTNSLALDFHPRAW